MVQLVFEELQLNPPAFEKTLYEVIVAPLLEGDCQVIVALRPTFVDLTSAGASGGPTGTTEFDGEDGLLEPMLLTAVTVKL